MHSFLQEPGLGFGPLRRQQRGLDQEEQEAEAARDHHLEDHAITHDKRADE